MSRKIGVPKSEKKGKAWVAYNAAGAPHGLVYKPIAWSLDLLVFYAKIPQHMILPLGGHLFKHRPCHAQNIMNLTTMFQKHKMLISRVEVEGIVHENPTKSQVWLSNKIVINLDGAPVTPSAAGFVEGFYGIISCWITQKSLKQTG